MQIKAGGKVRLLALAVTEGGVSTVFILQPVVRCYPFPPSALAEEALEYAFEDTMMHTVLDEKFSDGNPTPANVEDLRARAEEFVKNPQLGIAKEYFVEFYKDKNNLLAARLA